MAHAHAHSSTVMWDALSSLPPLRRAWVKLGRRACSGLASVHHLPRPRGYSSHRSLLLSSIPADTAAHELQTIPNGAPQLGSGESQNGQLPAAECRRTVSPSMPFSESVSNTALVFNRSPFPSRSRLASVAYSAARTPLAHTRLSAGLSPSAGWQQPQRCREGSWPGSPRSWWPASPRISFSSVSPR
jgi:hypothetical protein